MMSARQYIPPHTHTRARLAHELSSSTCRPGTALDEEAQRRSTSTYLPDRVIPMLPRALCEELCSLNAGVERLAFSVEWTLAPDGTILCVECMGGMSKREI